MDANERRRRMAIGLGSIEEVVYDVLVEARGNGEYSLTREQVLSRAGFPSHEYRAEGCAYILSIMENKGEVTNDRPDAGPDSWRLAD